MLYKALGQKSPKYLIFSGTRRLVMGQNKRHNMADKTWATGDDELLKRSRGGDMDAFGLLINKYQDEVLDLEKKRAEAPAAPTTPAK